MSQDYMGAPMRAGDTPLLAAFTSGTVIVLKALSRAQEPAGNLRIIDGNVEGKGAEGAFAQFTVHVRRPGVVALQNVQNRDCWISVYEGRTIGTGQGGPYCEFKITEIDNAYVGFESVMYPGQRLGVLPDGTVKDPTQTGTGPHGRFIPIIVSGGSSGPQPGAPPPQYYPTLPESVPSYYPPPQQYPQPTQQHPPPQQYLPPGGAPGYGAPPPSGYGGPPPSGAPGYGAPPYYAQPYPYSAPPMQGPAPPMPASGPVVPYGFSIMDAFKDGNVLQLLTRSKGFPIQIRGAGLFGDGAFGHDQSAFTVVIPEGQRPGVVMLRNVFFPGCYIAIRKNAIHGDGKGHKYCHLRVKPLPDNYVMFESVESPGQFLALNAQGVCRSPVGLGPSDQDAHFFVRVQKQLHGYSTHIMTPFGRPSIMNQLRDQSLIQLYVKSTGTYLSISNSGFVVFTPNGGDAHTFLKYSDRGMGIVSLHSSKYPGFRMRAFNGSIQAKGDDNINADFRVKESPDGSVTFESVSCPGVNIGIQAGPQYVTGLSISVVNIQNFGGSQTITKTPLN